MRTQLAQFNGQYVTVVGRLDKPAHPSRNHNDRGQFVLDPVTVAGYKYDHIWVKYFDCDIDVSKLVVVKTYTLRAKVYKYTRRSGGDDYGVCKATLVKSKPVLKAKSKPVLKR